MECNIALYQSFDYVETGRRPHFKRSAACWSIWQRRSPELQRGRSCGDSYSAPVTEAIDGSQLDLLALCLLVKAKERGDKHGECHCRGQHQDQHGTVLLGPTTDSRRFGFFVRWP